MRIPGRMRRWKLTLSPAAVALEKSNLGSLRGMTFKDRFGNVISTLLRPDTSIAHRSGEISTDAWSSQRIRISPTQPAIDSSARWRPSALSRLQSKRATTADGRRLCQQVIVNHAPSQRRC